MHTLRTRHALLRAVASQGRYAEAEAGYRGLCEAQTRTLGSDHPDTLNTRHDLALQAGKQGRHAEAAAMLRDVLKTRAQILGPQHPHTRATLHALTELTQPPIQP